MKSSLKSSAHAFAWIALALGLVWTVVWPHLDTATTSFPGYWVVGRLLLEGTPGVQLYDDAWLAAQMQAQGFAADRMLGPPAVALTMVPLAWLPYESARAAWMLGVVTPPLSAATWFLHRRLGPVAGLVFAAAVLFSGPVEAGMEVGQIYPLMLGLHCVGLWAWERDRPALGALGLAPMMFTRGWHGLPQALGWLVSGRWRGTAWALGLTAALVLLSVPILGHAAWTHFLLVHAAEAADSETAFVLAYQTWRSLALHLTSFHMQHSPDPPLLGWGRLPWLAGVAVIGLTSLWAARRLTVRSPPEGAARSGLGFALWTTVAMLLAPFAEDHQILLAALPAAVLWAESPRGRWLVLAAALLLVPIYRFDDPALFGGWRALTGYPRVYGELLLWLGILLEARRS